MADESVKTETTPQVEKPVTKVTEADLASAWESTQEKAVETKVETKPEPEGEHQEEAKPEPKGDEHQEGELPEEPADNVERSRLGRNLSNLQKKFDAFMEKFEQQTPQKPQQAQPPVENITYNDQFIQSQIEAAVERGELPATIVTPQDQLQVTRFMNGLQSYMGNQYANQYLGTLSSPVLKGDTPDDIHAEVVAELQRIESPFNLRRYDNPTLDAQVNYLEAKSAILMKKYSGKKPDNVFKGKPKDSPATGTSVSTRTDMVSEDIPELDQASQDLIKRMGISPETVKAALKNEMPYHLRGR